MKQGSNDRPKLMNPGKVGVVRPAKIDTPLKYDVCVPYSKSGSAGHNKGSK